MHQSRLAAIGIDCPSDVHDATGDFWSGALGATTPTTETEGLYTPVGRIDGREVFVQLINGDARVHLDIETDVVEAEVARLEALGAGRVRVEQPWWIMRDASSQPFCVVPPQSTDLSKDATTWSTTCSAIKIALVSTSSVAARPLLRSCVQGRTRLHDLSGVDQSDVPITGGLLDVDEVEV